MMQISAAIFTRGRAVAFLVERAVILAEGRPIDAAEPAE